MLTGLTGAAAFIEHIIVAGTTQNKLLKRRFSVFKRIQQYAYHVRAGKGQFFSGR